MAYKRVCKNHRRAKIVDWNGKPVWCSKYGEPTMAIGAWPRGKAYPYSSVRQNLRDQRKYFGWT